PEFRGSQSQSVLQKTLKGTVVEKHAALKVIAAVPSFGDSNELQVRVLLDDPNPLVSAAAAQCLLANTIRKRQVGESVSVLEKVLTKLQQDEDTGMVLSGVTMDRDTIQ